MPKKIPLIEMRKWLRQYEQGKSVASIARRVRHDVRTVARGIEQARHETQARAARGEMLKEALQKHQEDLAEVIEALRSAIVLPPSSVVLPTKGSAFQRVSLTGGTAERSNSGWTVTLDIEGGMKWELFQEHMRRDPIWKVIFEWKKAVAAYLQASFVLRQRVLKVLREATGLEFIESIDKAGNRYLYPAGAQFIYELIVNSALGISKYANLERELRIDDPHLNYGQERIPILTAPGAVDEFKAKVQLVFAELQKPAITKEIVTSYMAVEDITRKASKAIEELSLLRLIPGQCRVCRRLLGS